MRPRNLVCVGGPMNGQKVSLPAHSRHFIVARPNEPVFMRPAYMDDPSVMSPHLTVNEVVYQVERIQMVNDGLSVTIEVLAYMGKEGADRPKGFHL